MIKIEEILKNAKLESLNSEIQNNIKVLLDKVNQVRTKYGKPMTVTSGLRTMEDHIRIYKEKAAKEGKPYDQAKVPMGSTHLSGCAVDISDPKKELQAWCKANIAFLESLGVYLEDFSATPNWVHLQSVPFKSYKKGGSIFFKP